MIKHRMYTPCLTCPSGRTSGMALEGSLLLLIINYEVVHWLTHYFILLLIIISFNLSFKVLIHNWSYIVGQPDKYHWVLFERLLHVMTWLMHPMACVTLNRLQRLMVKRKRQFLYNIALTNILFYCLTSDHHTFCSLF